MRHLGPRGRPEGQHRCPADDREREGDDVLCQPLAADEGVVGARGAAVGEEVGGDLDGVEAVGAEGRRAIRDVDARQRNLVGHDLAHLGAQPRRQGQVGRRRQVRVGRDRAEVLLGQREGRGRLEVAGDRQHRVVRARSRWRRTRARPPATRRRGRPSSRSWSGGTRGRRGKRSSCSFSSHVAVRLVVDRSSGARS